MLNNIGALISTDTILGVHYYSYSNGPQNPILILKALILLERRARALWRR